MASDNSAPATYAMETNASPAQLDFRARLEEKYRTTPLPIDHLMCNFGMYMRSSVLVKFLVLNDLYTRILRLPGAIMEFGTWWGQNLVVFENLRAIYEPFNKTRKIVGFDTFKGYTGFSEMDPGGKVVAPGGYAVSEGYRAYLEELLAIHEGNNVMGHLRQRHEVIEGDVIEALPRYLTKHPETVVALAYFDMALYEPTKVALHAIRPHLVPGSVILLDEFSWAESPGEAIAFREVFKDANYLIERSQFTAERVIVTVR
jgi:hypothetical protein